MSGRVLPGDRTPIVRPIPPDRGIVLFFDISGLNHPNSHFDGNNSKIKVRTINSGAFNLDGNNNQVEFFNGFGTTMSVGGQNNTLTGGNSFNSTFLFGTFSKNNLVDIENRGKILAYGENNTVKGKNYGEIDLSGTNNSFAGENHGRIDVTHNNAFVNLTPAARELSISPLANTTVLSIEGKQAKVQGDAGDNDDAVQLKSTASQSNINVDLGKGKDEFWVFGNTDTYSGGQNKAIVNLGEDDDIAYLGHNVKYVGTKEVLQSDISIRGGAGMDKVVIAGAQNNYNSVSDGNGGWVLTHKDEKIGSRFTIANDVEKIQFEELDKNGNALLTDFVPPAATEPGDDKTSVDTTGGSDSSQSNNASAEFDQAFAQINP